MALDSVSSILQVVVVNAVLSGDNAVVIALAAHHLPAPERRKAMLLGSGLAIVLRLSLTVVVSWLLLVPGLSLLGAVLLAYIGCKLLLEEDRPSGHSRVAAGGVKAAIARIALADVVMSFDNVVAVAGVSHSDPVCLTVGLVISITLILGLSGVIVAIMERQRWIVYVGTAILALAAAAMIGHDLDHFGDLVRPASQPKTNSDAVGWPIRLGLVAICLTSRNWWPKGRKPRSSLSQNRTTEGERNRRLGRPGRKNGCQHALGAPKSDFSNVR
jgi:YjbE family integral membrane protein